MKVSALDESGKPVDWWFMYKVPKLGAGVNGDAATGYEYVYYDSNIDAKGGKIDASQYTIDSGKGALNETMNSLLDESATLGYVLYNDEAPDAAKITDNGNLGHTKGVIAFDLKTKTAFWLLHSWPKFYEPKAKNDPTPMYGQTYLCFTLTLDTARKVAAQMINHQEPQTYLCRKADAMDGKDPLLQLMGTIDPNAAGDSNTIDLKTAAGMKFKVIAKNRKWNDDFWNGLVGPTLGEDIDVETWIRGNIPPIADSDGVHKTYDIKYIDLGALGLHWVWPESHDHAKWAITLKSDWGVHRRHQSHGFAAKARRRDDRIPERNAVAGAVEDELSPGAAESFTVGRARPAAHHASGALQADSGDEDRAGGGIAEGGRSAGQPAGQRAESLPGEAKRGKTGREESPVEEGRREKGHREEATLTSSQPAKQPEPSFRRTTAARSPVKIERRPPIARANLSSIRCAYQSLSPSFSTNGAKAANSAASGLEAVSVRQNGATSSPSAADAHQADSRPAAATHAIHARRSSSSARTAVATRRDTYRTPASRTASPTARTRDRPPPPRRAGGASTRRRPSRPRSAPRP